MSDAFDDLERKLRRAVRSADNVRPLRSRRGSRRLPPVVIALLALVVPSALALRAAVSRDRSVDIPGLNHVLPGQAPPTGATVAIARGTVDGHRYTYAAKRCGTGSAVSLITALKLYGSLGVTGRCPKPAHAQPPLTATWMWSPGQTWFIGIVRADVATVELSAVRTRRLANGRRTAFDPVRLRITTRPLDPEAVRQGHLPSNLRLFVAYRPYRSEFGRVVARDTHGHVVATCPHPC